MKKAFFLALILLLNGCSYESFLALGEVDKVELVKKNASVAHYRAYFTRTQLKPIKKRQKYLYFYNKKNKDLAILLYKDHTYTLYSLYHPEKSKISLHAKEQTQYKDIKKALRKQGYLPTYPHAVGATSSVALRKYKGIKTLLVEIKDYHTLQAKYRNAIKHYDASTILHSKTTLPRVLIAEYLSTYQKRATTQAQKIQLQRIAEKLHLQAPTPIVEEEESKVQEALANEIPEEVKVPASIQEAISYDYYAQESSYFELDTYLNDPETKNRLTFNQYTNLTKRHAQLKEAELLKEGSLEELIAAYKTTKNPKYKQRILTLMKEAQQ